MQADLIIVFMNLNYADLRLLMEYLVKVPSPGLLNCIVFYILCLGYMLVEQASNSTGPICRSILIV